MRLRDRIEAGPIECCEHLGNPKEWADGPVMVCSCRDRLRCHRCFHDHGADHVDASEFCDECGTRYKTPARFAIPTPHRFDVVTASFSMFPGAVMEFHGVELHDTRIACADCASLHDEAFNSSWL